MPEQMLQKVLHVEDDDDIQMLVRLALQEIGGFTVLTCSTGQEALEQASGFAPDMILLDVMMPDMDGPSTLQALRAQTGLQKTPVIFMTAKAQPSEVEAYKAFGALDVIVKPFDPMILAQKLQSLWETRNGADPT